VEPWCGVDRGAVAVSLCLMVKLSVRGSTKVIHVGLNVTGTINSREHLLFTAQMDIGLTKTQEHLPRLIVNTLVGTQ
jgi:hypothetical protein